jgi:predicted transposase YdaD
MSLTHAHTQVAAALEVAREQAAKDQVLAVSQVQRGVEAEASRSTVELRAAHGEAMSELEGKLAEADEEIAKLREELKQQVAETLQEVGTRHNYGSCLQHQYL